MRWLVRTDDGRLRSAHVLRRRPRGTHPAPMRSRGGAYFAAADDPRGNGFTSPGCTAPLAPRFSSNVPSPPHLARKGAKKATAAAVKIVLTFVVVCQVARRCY